MSLRIDVVKASAPLGSTVNIARINTEARQADNAAHFAEIAKLERTEGQVTHVFATLAY